MSPLYLVQLFMSYSKEYAKLRRRRAELRRVRKGFIRDASVAFVLLVLVATYRIAA